MATAWTCLSDSARRRSGHPFAFRFRRQDFRMIEIEDDRPNPAGDALRLLAVVAITSLATAVSIVSGLTFEQTTSVTVFTLIIAAALFFWDYHLAIAFVGIGVLLLLNVMDIPDLVVKSKLDVILFIIGMMIVVGVLKELGLFSWIIIAVISTPKLSARRFVVTACLLGAVMSCVVDEITAIVFIAALVFQVCDTLNLRPVPFVIMAVMTVNIGSAGTMLGNPIGILIGQNANPPLSFNDFMIWSFPLMAAELLVVLVYLLWAFRREIAGMDLALRERREAGLTLGPILKVPFRRSLFVLLLLMGSLSSHSMAERLLGLPPNTILIAAPMVLSGVLMLWRRARIRKYIENDVEWCALIFFMMLFVVAGTLEHTRVTAVIADGFAAAFGDRPEILIPIILGISIVGSAFVENIIFVASFMPVVVRLEQTPLLWALLHGACLGGNITIMGSTANIAAFGMLEKRYWTKINFFTWLKTGVMVGLLSFLVAWLGLVAMAPHMPTQAERMEAKGMAAARSGPPIAKSR